MPAAISVVLLPGMDGTGRLFEAFIAELPVCLRPVVVSYPVDRSLGYTELEPLVEAMFPVVGQFVVLAESFSGPLALRIAARGHPRLAAIVLVATFARNPMARWLSGLRWLVGSWCFRKAPPAWVIRRFLAGDNASNDLVAAVQASVATVAPHVLVKRLRQILEVDDRRTLPRIQVPVLSISGSQDRLVTPRHIEDLRALGNHIEYAILEAPHLVLQREPVSAVRIIEEFLRRKMGVEQ